MTKTSHPLTPAVADPFTPVDRFGRALFLVSLLLCNAAMTVGLVARAVSVRQPSVAAPNRFLTPRPPQLGDVHAIDERA